MLALSKASGFRKKNPNRNLPLILRLHRYIKILENVLIIVSILNKFSHVNVMKKSCMVKTVKS